LGEQQRKIDHTKPVEDSQAQTMMHMSSTNHHTIDNMSWVSFLAWWSCFAEIDPLSSCLRTAQLQVDSPWMGSPLPESIEKSDVQERSSFAEL
jgi:hypothetical protein